jgi:hypothetical protein
VAVRSLTLGPRGAVTTLDDGSIVIADGQGRLGQTIEPPPCPVIGAADGKRGLLALCRDGTLLRRAGERWTGVGRAPAATGLAGWPELHVWGPSGLYREYGDGGWLRLVGGPVAAAAVSVDGLAWFDGSKVVVSDGRGSERPVTMPPGGVAHLALQDGDLWAVDGRGRLWRSGGGVLPWRDVVSPSVRVAAAAGDGARLLVIVNDGLLAAWTTDVCASPWEGGTGRRSGALQEPRGIAVSPAGWFVVADTRNYRVRWFDEDGACLDAWGQRGAGVGQFEDPAGVALADDGTLAVADTWNGRVQVLGPAAEPRVVAQGLYGPRAVVWWPDGRLFIAISASCSGDAAWTSRSSWRSSTPSRSGSPRPATGWRWRCRPARRSCFSTPTRGSGWARWRFRRGRPSGRPRRTWRRWPTAGSSPAWSPRVSCGWSTWRPGARRGSSRALTASPGSACCPTAR